MLRFLFYRMKRSIGNVYVDTLLVYDIINSIFEDKIKRNGADFGDAENTAVFLFVPGAEIYSSARCVDGRIGSDSAR